MAWEQPMALAVFLVIPFFLHGKTEESKHNRTSFYWYCHISANRNLVDTIQSTPLTLPITAAVSRVTLVTLFWGSVLW